MSVYSTCAAHHQIEIMFPLYSILFVSEQKFFGKFASRIKLSRGGTTLRWVMDIQFIHGQQNRKL